MGTAHNEKVEREMKAQEDDLPKTKELETARERMKHCDEGKRGETFELREYVYLKL